MGVISRQVLPVCANFACFACPGLRARSRQPAKRYKTLVANIYPKKQDASVNDRAVGKLADYAEQNPNRIPTIVNKLEQRGFKDLRARQLGFLKATTHAYGKLLSACKEHMPLFALSALSMMKALLEDRDQEMHILACQLYTDFALNQLDTTYAYEMDRLLPLLVAVTRESGEEKHRRALRAAGLHALAAVIWYTVEFSHIPPDLDELVTAVLDNYEVVPEEGGEGSEVQPRGGHHGAKEEAQAAVKKLREAAEKLHKAGRPGFLPKDIGHVSKMDVEHPEVWAHICVQGLGRVACQDATQAKRVLDPVLRYLDNGAHWERPPRCLALPLLLQMQLTLDASGNSDLLPARLVRHIQHYGQVSVHKWIVQIIQELVRASSLQPFPSAVAPLRDLSQILCRSLEFVRKAEKEGSVQSQSVVEHRELQLAIEECLPCLAQLVGQSGPFLDTVVLVLESVSWDPLAANSTLEALGILAHASQALLEHPSTAPQVFPDTLLFHLLQVMWHPDPTTRTQAHHLLALLLPPAALAQDPSTPGAHGGREQDGNLGARSPPRREERGWESSDSLQAGGGGLKAAGSIAGHKLGRMQSLRMTLEKNFSKRLKSHPTSAAPVITEMERVVRVNAVQAGLLLSSLHRQALLPDSIPSCYAALAHTFILAILLSPPKASSQSMVIRAVQLALTLRTSVLDGEGSLPPSQRRSLLTLATAMLLALARVYVFPTIATEVREPLVRDPWLELKEDGTLAEASPGSPSPVYGSAEDDVAAAEALVAVEVTANSTPAGIVQLILAEATWLEPAEGADVASRMLQRFEPDDSYMLRPRDFSLPPEAAGPAIAESSESMFEIEGLPLNGGPEEDLPASSSMPDLDRTNGEAEVRSAPSVAELLQSLTATSAENQLLGQTEAAEGGDAKPARTRALELLDEAGSESMSTSAGESFREDPEDGEVSSSLNEAGVGSRRGPSGAVRSDQGKWWKDFTLPPTSPYDDFLKAAGC